MEVKVYRAEGRLHNVTADQEKAFKIRYPDAVLVGIPGAEEPKTETATEPVATVKGYTPGGKPQGPTASTTEGRNLQVQDQKDTESLSGDGSLDYVKKALDKHRSYGVTEEQRLEAQQRAETRLAYLNSPESTDYAGALREVKQKEEGEGFLSSVWSNLGREMSLTPKNVAKAKEAQEQINTNLKERASLTNEAYAKLLAEHNEGKPVNERIRPYDEDGVPTDEWYNWLDTVSEEDIEAAKKESLVDEYEDQYFDDNVKEEMENRDAWHGVTKSESQKEEEQLAIRAIEQMDKSKADLIKRQKALTNGVEGLQVKYEALGALNEKLDWINNRIGEITSVKYTDQESYDKAQAEYTDLKSKFDEIKRDYIDKGGMSLDDINTEREAYLKAFGRIEDSTADFVENEEDLAQYLDAMKRNYGWGANIAMSLASGVVQTGASLAQVYEMAQDIPVNTFSDIAHVLPDSVKPYAAGIERGLSVAGKVMLFNYTGAAIEATTGEDATEILVDKLWAWDDAITNRMEKPKEFSELESAQDYGEWIGHLVSTQAANTAIAFGTGGAALFILGASGAGGKFHDIEEEMKAYAALPDGHPMKNFKYTKAQQYTAAALVGSFEGFSETVTVGHARWVKAMLKNNPGMKRGFNNFVKRNFFTRTGLYNNFYTPVEEGATEVISQLGSNITDRLVLGKEISLLEGVNESFVSGLFMSGVAFKSPLIGKNMVKIFQSSDVSAEQRRISDEINRKVDLLNTYDLSDENRKNLERQIGQLVEKHTILTNETVDGVQNMSAEARQELLEIDVEKATLRQANKDIEADPLLNAEQTKELLQENKLKDRFANARKNLVIANANKDNNASQIERTVTRLQREIEKITGKPAQVFKANNKTLKEALEAFKNKEKTLVRSQIDKKKTQLENASGAEAAKLQRDISKLEKYLESTDFRYSLANEDVKSAQGFVSDHTGNIFINTEISAETGGTNVVNHEFMHVILRQTLADNPAAAIAMGNAVDEYLAGLDPAVMEDSALAARLKAYEKEPSAVRAEEKITLFMDAIATGDIKIKKTGNKRLGNAMRRIMQSGVGQNFGADSKHIEIELNTPEDVYNFITDFQASRKSIFFNEAISKAAKEGIKIGEGLMSGVTQEQLDTLAAEEVGDIKASKGADVTDEVNELAALGWTKGSWKESGAEFALGTMIEEKMLDGLIAAKLKVPMTPIATKEFIQKVYAELTNHVKNFNPEENDSLFGWVNSQLANKAGNVYNREYKITEESRALDIDAKTPEGAPIVQIAADTDVEMARIDDIGLTSEEKEERSKLRRDLKLDDEMVAKVRDTVMKTFGTKLPEVDSKEFKSALQKAFQTELKKPIQDMMGGRADFEFFLIDNFNAIFKALPVSTLVQLERRIDADKRIFTESRRITKPVEVDALMAEGRLPKDTNRLSGPYLHTKKPTPSSEKILAFYRGKNMKGELGYKVGGSTLGTRKDRLAMEIGIELGFDATSEVLQDSGVQERRRGILEVQGLEQLENELAVIAKVIDRDPSIKFSKAHTLNSRFKRGVDHDIYVKRSGTLYKPLLDKLNKEGINSLTKDDVFAAFKSAFNAKDLTEKVPVRAWKPTATAVWNRIAGKQTWVSNKDVDSEEYLREIIEDAHLKNTAISRLQSLADGHKYKLGSAVRFVSRLMDNNNQITRNRDQIKAVWDKLGEDKTLSDAERWEMMEALIPQYTSAGRIHRSPRMENEIPITDTQSQQRKTGKTRYQTMAGVAHLFKVIDVTADEVEGWRAEIRERKSGEAMASDSRENIENLIGLENAELNKEFEVREKQAKIYRDAFDYVLDYYQEGIDSGDLNTEDLLVYLAGAMSSSKSAWRRGAPLRYIPEKHIAGTKYDIDHNMTVAAAKERIIENIENGRPLKEGIWDNFYAALIPSNLHAEINKTDIKAGMGRKGFSINGELRMNQLYLAGELPSHVIMKDMKTGDTLGEAFHKANKELIPGTELRASRSAPRSSESMQAQASADISNAINGQDAGGYASVKFSKAHKAEYEKQLLKKRPDLSGDEVDTILDRMFEFVDGLPIKEGKKRRLEKISMHWIANGFIKLPEDGYKIVEAERLATNKKVDPFSIENPNEIIEKYAGTPSVKRVSPDSMEEFSDKQTLKHGVTIYTVENSKKGQRAVRTIIDSHFGKKANPWCIVATNKDGELLDHTWKFWKSYGSNKRLAFKDGKLIGAYTKKDGEQGRWWDRQDRSSEDLLIKTWEEKSNGIISTWQQSINEDSGESVTIETKRIKGNKTNGKYTVYVNPVVFSQELAADGLVLEGMQDIKPENAKLEISEEGEWVNGSPVGTHITYELGNRNAQIHREHTWEGGVPGKGVLKIIELRMLDGETNSDKGPEMESYKDGKLHGPSIITDGGIDEKGEAWNYQFTTNYVNGLRHGVETFVETGELVWVRVHENGEWDGITHKGAKGQAILDKHVGETNAGKDIRFSKAPNLSNDFNKMLGRATGTSALVKFTAAEAKARGAKKNKFRFFVPPSAEDFAGIMRYFVGRGEQGNEDLRWFKENLFDPFNAGDKALNTLAQSMASDYKALKKEYKGVVNRLNENVPGTSFTVEQAIRVYLWKTLGMEVPGLARQTNRDLVSFVSEDVELSSFALLLGNISKQDEGYVKPTEFWMVNNIAMDLHNASSRLVRGKYFAKWKENKDVIFSEENLNKIEATYGNHIREALENILWRMEHGTNRPIGQDRHVNKWMNWVNGSIGATMFLNMRSAVLQSMSAVNFINFTDNNVFKAGAAFANQPQYWKDFAMIFNSDTLKQRRSGLRNDVSSEELAAAYKNGKGSWDSVMSALIQFGFTPTQVVDSFAIASGGATFYRNRVAKLVKEGMSKKDAEKQAFLDFQVIAEETQQSSRPDLISQQQAGGLGRVILAWQNTPMQYTRLTKKAIGDLANNRGDWKTNVSRIIYYGVAQNILFSALQSGLMFVMFGDEPDEEQVDKKGLRVANSVLDSLLRGTGIYGAMVATIKNVAMKTAEELEKGYGKKSKEKILIEAMNVSPPIGSKLRKTINAVNSYDYNKETMGKMDASFNNPAWDVGANLVEATTNVPLARVVNKAKNVELALSAGLEPWQRAALILGWSKWDVGVEDAELQEARAEVKEDKKEAAAEKRKAKKADKKKEEEERKKKSGLKDVRCSHIKSDGSRCKIMVETKSKTAKCHYHKSYKPNESTDIDNDGKKEYQCTATTSSGSRCKNRTENKSKKCYAHV